MVTEQAKGIQRLMQLRIPHVLIVLALVGTSLLVNLTVPPSARVKAHEWLQELMPRCSPQLEAFSEVEATNLQRVRLVDQLHLVKLRAKHHQTVAVYFFSNYYMALVEALVMGAIAAVALFFITKTGYGAANPHVVTVFITATVLAGIFGSFPSLFRQTENFAENKALYLRYLALQNEMLTYAATCCDANAKKLKASDFIMHIDQELNKVNNIAVGFDQSKLPSITMDLK